MITRITSSQLKSGRLNPNDASLAYLKTPEQEAKEREEREEERRLRAEAEENKRRIKAAESKAKEKETWWLHAEVMGHTVSTDEVCEGYLLSTQVFPSASL